MWICSEFYFLHHVQLSASPIDLQQWLLSSQWRWSELQWEPKQLLQPVLVSSCPPESMMSMHGLCGVSWGSNKSCFSQANSPFTLSWPLPEAPSRFVFTFPLMSDRYGFVSGTEDRWHAWNDELASRWGLSALQTWNILKLRNILCGRGFATEGGKAVYCHCDDPDILEQPRGASLFARSSAGFEKTWSQSSVLCVCVRKSGHSGFSFLRGCSRLLCKTMWPCAVRVNMIG